MIAQTTGTSCNSTLNQNSLNKATQISVFSPFHIFLLLSSLFLWFHQTVVNGQLRLQGKQDEGKGKCPFDPFQRYSSLMIGKCVSQTHTKEFYNNSGHIKMAMKSLCLLVLPLHSTQ